MDRWTGRVALVTGASSGIGAAIAKELTLKGMKVVGAARRVEKVEELSVSLKSAPGKLYPLKFDVTNEENILEGFQWIEKTLGGVDVVVNNAGVLRSESLYDGSTAMWREMYETNVIGLSICTREAIKSMKSRGVDDGHVIHINSIAGHRVGRWTGVAVYSASKYGVTALTDGLRQELIAIKSRIRVTSISPGLVRTEILDASSFADRMNSEPLLNPKDIADAVLYALGAPPHVQIFELTIKPVGERS